LKRRTERQDRRSQGRKADMLKSSLGTGHLEENFRQSLRGRSDGYGSSGDSPPEEKKRGKVTSGGQRKRCEERRAWEGEQLFVLQEEVSTEKRGSHRARGKSKFSCADQDKNSNWMKGGLRRLQKSAAKNDGKAGVILIP